MKLRKDIRTEDLHWEEFFVDAETYKELSEEDEGAEKVRFGLKFLKIGEMNRVHDEVYNIKANVKGRRERRIETKFQYGLFLGKKMETAIAEWEGITDEEGNVLPITVENIELLPAWIGSRLSNIIDDMNQIGIEYEGE